MDGNTTAKLEYERRFHPKLFPIVQQTYVLPVDKTEAFIETCMDILHERRIRPTESDMLFCRQDSCFLSATYKQDGFAVSFGFEPIAPDGCPRPELPQLLTDLSDLCLNQGGRIHPVKNMYADPATLHRMYPVKEFVQVKQRYDPNGILHNTLSYRWLGI
jgi:FAD/FMN-containing dehydrogenase